MNMCSTVTRSLVAYIFIFYLSNLGIKIYYNLSIFSNSASVFRHRNFTLKL
uniref:Uncharacterized protein n=1 Tax=Arundo donax TaxID=35708 RepID=A0A0A9CDK5_ARUDO